MKRGSCLHSSACSIYAALALAISPVAHAQIGPLTEQAAYSAVGTLSLAQLKAHYQDADSRFVQIGGMRIRYKDEGKGPAIVLLHGSHSSLDGYDGLARNLAGSYRVIRFDMPGMGLSETLPVSTATETPYADDILKALLDTLKIERAALVGVSSGGAIAYYFASRFPDKVDALILTNTPSEPVVDANTPRSPVLRAQFDEAKRTGFRSRLYWATYLSWLTGEPSRLSEQKIDRYYDMNRRTPMANARLFWRSSGNIPGVYATLATIKAPTLLVWGKIDFVLPLHTMDSLRAKMPASSVSTVVLTDVGHYPPFEIPDRFSNITKTYLQNIIK